MKHCPRAVSIARPSTLQLTALPSELAAAPGQRVRLQKKCAKLRGFVVLRGGWRVDCEKMCGIKRVGALRCRRRVDCEKMCEIKRVGALRGRWSEDGEKSAKLRS